ncbi:periplasmic divalent cation tolerance protein [Rhodoblastus acidophilus]|uniref:divalent-cation tolerance protein CutA n=1 Tax=Rhodoblastus acidophilus TaxID=1074 RepID=UPI0022247688|nr:divalent-cation tolerance protein CutA [Rhodoblastus acidophilus]MCW2282407.1 periplasmic divalent cation tolerance protein [Rhodoblastus acidophilus]MCW2331188.1 periplasmic divalent cation tolerance protein [Rhodoblastus acidophilus]
MDLAFCVVQTTVDDEARAHQMAAALVTQKLAACVQVTEVVSHYVWKGAAAREKEYLLAAKARRGDFDAVAAAIRALHSYELPEIIATPVVAGDPSYLDWLRRETER